MVLKNYQRIIKANGLTNLINLLCRIYIEIADKKPGSDSKPELIPKAENSSEEIKLPPLEDKKDTKEKKIKDSNARQPERVKRGGLIIRIFDLMLKTTDKRYIYILESSIVDMSTQCPK